MNIRTRMIGLASALLVAIAIVPQSAIAKKPAPEPVKPSPSADLSLSITDSPDPALLLNEITYVMTIANAGPSNASAWLHADIGPNVRVTYPPCPLQCGALVEAPGLYSAWVTSVTSSQGTCALGARDWTGWSQVSCELGLLPRGVKAQVTVVVQPLELGTITLSANAWGDQPDPNTSNNQKSESTTVVSPVGDVQPVGDLCEVDVPRLPGPTTGIENFIEYELCAVTKLL